MKKPLKITLISLGAVLAVLLAVVLVFTGVYFTRFQTVDSIEKLTNYDDRYNLYRMDVKYNYSLDDVINYGITDNQTMIDAILSEALPMLPVSIQGTRLRLHGVYADRYRRRCTYGAQLRFQERHLGNACLLHSNGRL